MYKRLNTINFVSKIIFSENAGLFSHFCRQFILQLWLLLCLPLYLYHFSLEKIHVFSKPKSLQYLCNFLFEFFPDNLIFCIKVLSLRKKKLKLDFFCDFYIDSISSQNSLLFQLFDLIGFTFFVAKPWDHISSHTKRHELPCVLFTLLIVFSVSSVPTCTFLKQKYI